MYLPIYLSTYLSIYLSACLSVCLSIYLSIDLSIYPKQSYCARFPSKVATDRCKTKQFCETSLKHEKLSAELTASYHCALPFFYLIFPSHLSKVLRLPRKSGARSYEVLHLSREITLHSKPEDLMLQNPSVFDHVWRPNVLRATTACLPTSKSAPRPRCV